jgi:hypothetical protein
MTIDRLLIICSIIELSFIAICDGPDCFNYFQWTAISLLLVKGLLVFAQYRRMARSASAQVGEQQDRSSSIDMDNAD